ncbi:MAG: Tol-Pal system beta propeller repeat protein TolB, partial [Proteobacteria bacterium]|nr:Tol-Pal system beta propeller repeat protein TolB [Pseudomonadota bacterium]
MKKLTIFGFLISGLLVMMSLSGAAVAELRIEITRGMDNAVRVAVVPFEWRGKRQLPLAVDEVVAADLGLSGRFTALPVNQMLSFPNDASEVLPRDWRMLNVEYLVIGYIEPDDAGVSLHFQLFDVLRGAVVEEQTIVGVVGELRDMAHHVSDVVFEKLTGIEGAFSTQIMYVTAIDSAAGREFTLNIADADGHRVNTILRSNEPILSATWSPDGEMVAYVSFEKDGRPAIYLHEIASGNRQILTSFSGLNGAPAFSPDGKELALVLSKDGNPDIYILDLQTRRLRRITRHYGIDTEPSWTPDGKALIFTSNRGGKPQIYQIRLSDFQIQRLTFEGDYNAKASLLRDGSGLVFVHRREGIFHIALLDLNRGRLSVLTETTLDESPSVAPNGAMLIYATLYRGEGILAAVSV